MPELPEIETVKLQLLKVLVGRQILGLKVRNRGTVHGDINLVIGKKVENVRRKGKALLIDVSGDLSMAFHFKMSGQLIYDKDGSGVTWKDRVVGGHPTEDFVGKLPSSHTRVIFDLDQGRLYFNDQRMFGWLKVGDRADVESDKFFLKLGPEPFDISAEEFVRRLGKVKRPIKVAIMDQEIISGVGNIYANDALWEAGIDPRVSSSQLSVEQLGVLLEKIKLVLNEGIEYGGATAADAKYIDLHGLGGRYQEHFRTYDQEGKKCKKCGGVITKTMLGGRGTFYCLGCQV